MAELLSHVEAQARTAELRVERSRAYRTEDADEERRRFWGREDLAAAKWRRWAVALEAVVMGEGKGE